MVFNFEQSLRTLMNDKILKLEKGKYCIKEMYYDCVMDLLNSLFKREKNVFGYIYITIFSSTSSTSMKFACDDCSNYLQNNFNIEEFYLWPEFKVAQKKLDIGQDDICCLMCIFIKEYSILLPVEGNIKLIKA